MKKVFLIIEREYLSRVKKKSFLILTFLVPSLFIAMYAAVFFIYKSEGESKKEFLVLDESGLFKNEFKNSETTTFKYADGDYASNKSKIKNEKDLLLLYIPKDYASSNDIEILSAKKPGFSLLNDVEKQMENIIENKKLIAAGIDTAVLKNSKTQININAKQLTDEGEKDSNIGATYVVGFISSFLIYLSLFIYGAQVMRGVIEEKTNRIVEVIVSSVKPFQLMLGKILGIGAVGLTQFLLWIILSSTISIAAGKFLTPDQQTVTTEKVDTKASTTNTNPNKTQESPAIKFINAANTINFPYIIGSFLFYFIGGYLIYSALFAAVGSAVDNETETQQFMFPITLPLIFTFIVGMNVIINNPDGPLAFWLSMIPLTSPIAMMIRIPFGVPAWELILSIVLLIAGFVFTTWIASRIYRVGILMYGKKVTYKELAKWFFYKE
ncbi:ABC transporter permease [Pedobacter puniceum]|uniref:ABC transporter permease n=1 Tax=Pedobacter puniceum TaxID=2666136 RepID=A0A7K0FN76_9SPHI|nr:ABC transporter permease [Pedobacter puniceum]MRX46875.1 ABC transporter permease [Pedobacter puniceum]